uniref:Uncharacterized sensor-like histidine kinase ycf26 n=1 Tax=Balbiania investiens TaxID=111861 RepID=A0A4D6BP45_9FLOR|nr:Drug sensory protein A [Balbiania investiens]QBX88723.1 Drug sensory protein A [Balbiania investiens]
MIKIFQVLRSQWHNINIQARLMAFITLAIAICMSSATFWVLTSIRQKAILTESHVTRDISLLCTTPLLAAIEQKSIVDLSIIAEKIYLNVSSLRYLILLDVSGQVYFSFPEYVCDIQDLLSISQDLLTYSSKSSLFYKPIAKYAFLLKDPVIDMVVPLVKDGYTYGSLDIGINSNPRIAYSSFAVQKITIVIFVSMWGIVMLTSLFHSLTISIPVQELLFGIQRIAKGDFTARINFPLEGELGNLILYFNEMAEKLECYEKKNIEQLISEQSKLETLVSIITDGVILLDKELRIIFINHSASQTFKAFRYGMVGTHFASYLSSRINEKLFPILNRMVQSNYIDNSYSETQEIALIIDYEASRTFRFILTTVFDPDRGVLTGIAIIMQDISKEIELNEAKAQFISNVSHELRTPLFNIRSFLETLSEYNESLSSKQKIEFLDIATQETLRLTCLVNDVLELSRLESDVQYAIDNIDLTEMISSIVQTSQLRAINKKVKLSFQICPKILGTNGYYILLTQVISNLIGNALKFTQLDGRILIKVYSLNLSKINQDYDRIRIEVIDEGSGISLCDQSRIFERFVRIENNIHTLEGTGLGLSIVKNIVEKHQSNIYLYSESGIGSSFWFDLSLIQQKN